MEQPKKKKIINCLNFNLGDKMGFIPSSCNYCNTRFSKIQISVKNFLKTLLFQDHNSRYSKDLIANSLRFLEGIHESERQVELEKLSEHPCRLVVVDRSFEQSLQNACRNLSKEGLKIKFESMLTEKTKSVQVAPTTGIGKAIEVVNCAMKKVNHALYRGEVFRKSEKGKPFIKVIPLTLLLKFNLLFQFLICKVNDFDLKQFLF